jgi:hypothetical protein
MNRDQLASQWLNAQDALIRRCDLCGAHVYRVKRCQHCAETLREARLELVRAA